MTDLSLPEKCGVMLLPDCTLFPHGGMPLRIFEPRYREMLTDALAGECIFAIGCTNEVFGEENPVVPSIGTAGLVRASKEASDGTSQLLLHGIVRVQFLEWLDESSYPCALVKPLIPTKMKAQEGKAAVLTLRGCIEDAIMKLPDEVQSGVMDLLNQADEPELLSDLVAQQFVSDSDLRQKLLETQETGARIRMLCEYLASGGLG